MFCNLELPYFRAQSGAAPLKIWFYEKPIVETEMERIEKLATALLRADGGDGNPLGCGRYAVGQAHIPAALALVHLQDHAADTGRMVDGGVHEQKIRTHLNHGNGIPVDQQPHFYQGGMSAVT